MHARTKHLGVPILTGIWPLLNGRQTEFLHHEVPGIIIPDQIRSRMAGTEGQQGRRQGIEIAKDVVACRFGIFPGHLSHHTFSCI